MSKKRKNEKESVETLNKSGHIKSYKKKEISLSAIIMYIGGGIVLSLAVYLLSQMGIMWGWKWERIFFFLLPATYWSSTLIALSSKTKLSDVTLTSIPLLVTFLVLLGDPGFFLNLEDALFIGLYRICFGFVFTLLLLGYDLPSIPRKGFIEYGIYGLSFIPLISSLIFVGFGAVLPHFSLIFASLVLFKVFLTVVYVSEGSGTG